MANRCRGLKTTQHDCSSTANRYWSAKVTRDSDVLELAPNVFTWRDPKRIARSLKSSADASDRPKANPHQSAMSILNFYVNRAGRSLSREVNRCSIRQRSNCAAYLGEPSLVSSFRGDM
jgi:hypothetical protein